MGVKTVGIRNSFGGCKQLSPKTGEAQGYGNFDNIIRKGRESNGILGGTSPLTD